ncbi:SMI1/KNR4 family protein [Acinetobacter johnsonii]|uniref:SMI1/KNR4 family protein n=1 Tax=Acinetobacter johnsonii TaxID=40214 RepID=UPI00280E18C4|nr:SMI1/KNR4 family protein [Acinetobacter johnsonii]MDQ8975904.1 SMI1/KNR4 family protein [Acinetobacter johnsonii]
MQNKLDNIIQELKELSGNSRLNIELPDDIFISAYERKIGFIFPKDYKKVLKEISNIFYGTIELASLTDEKECYRGLSQILNDAREQGLPECQRQFKTDPFYLKNSKVKLTPLMIY